MLPSQILLLIVVISIISYLFHQWLEYLNLRAQRSDLPAEVSGFFDRDKYVKALSYQRAQTKFSFVSSTLSFAVTMSMLLLGGFGWIDQFLRPYFHNEVALALAFFGLILIASDLLSLPLQWYSTFVIEERFGFNKTTVRTFITDKLKGYLLGAVVGGGLLALMIYLIRVFGPQFWLWFGLISAGFILLLNMFYTSLILPLFNKLTLLPEGELKSAIQVFTGKVGFPLDNAFVVDGSRRSKKANAFFSGIGKRKKIVLYDTLIANHTVDELVAVLAHEIGHYKMRHIIWNYALSVVQVFFVLFILSRMVDSTSLSMALGGNQAAIHLNLIAFAILFSPISGITGLLMSMRSRRNEFEADAFARNTLGGAPLARALKKLSVDSLSNLYPHPVYVFFHYSHPPLLKRLAALE